jgi:hypothetical protein
MQAVATQYYNLNAATKHRTRSGLIPFVIAHEVREVYKDSSGCEQLRTRVYYAFDSIQEFERVRKDFPNAHEVIWNRYTSDKQQGRLIFDFDFDEPWAGVKPNFVPKDFEKRIQEVVVSTFTKFYSGVDTSKFVWVWLVSDTEDKWSKHLVVKNAFFSHDWKAQMVIFYNLFLSVASRSGHFSITPFEKLIDAQVARNAATMRMCGSSKIGGKVLRLESPADASFEDTLIQLHTYKTIKAEQNITEAQLRKDVLSQLFFDKPEEVMKDRFLKAGCEKCYIDLSSYYESSSDIIVTQELAMEAFEAFEAQYCETFGVLKQDVFALGPASSQYVVLKRLRSAPCMISGKVHDAEHACLIVNSSSILFYCRRDCVGKDGMKCVRIFKRVSE